MSVQTAKKPDRFLAGYDNREKNAIIISALIAVADFFNGIYVLLFPLNPIVNYAIPTFLAAAASLVAFFFAIRRRRGVATAILLVSGYLLFLYFVVTTEGVGTSLALSFMLAGSGIGLAIFDFKQARTIVTFVVLGSVLLLLVELFWPLERYSAPSVLVNLINLTTVVLTLVYISIAVIQFPSYSLSGKIVVSIVMVILVALITVSVVFTVLISNTLTDQVGRNLQTFAQNEALSVGELLGSRVNTLETLATNGVLIGETQFQSGSYNDLATDTIQAQLQEYDLIWSRSGADDPVVRGVLDNRSIAEMEKFRVLFPDIVDIFIADQYGALVAATSRPFDYYQGDETWWQDTYLNGFGATRIGSPYFDPEKESWLLEVSVPLRGVDNLGRTEVTGVLLSVVRMDAFGDLLASSAFGETGEVQVLMPDGRIMSFDEATGTLSIDWISAEENNFVVDLDADYTKTNINTNPSLLSGALVRTLSVTSGIRNLNWSVVVHQAEEEALVIVTQLRVISGILIVVMLFVTGGLAAFVGRKLSKPIVDLTAVAQQVADGDLTAHAEVSSINKQDEIGTLTMVFNQMTERLQEAITTLEFRVEERTHAIATSSDVGRRLSTILDRDHLVEEVVTQIRQAFDYYHVHIYLFDKGQRNLLMVGGTGEAGQQMLATGHQIGIGQGLVGRAALTNAPVLVSDVTTEEGWLPNPLLPETKAETAVPIAVGDRVLGVLDVQQDETYGLTENDVELLVSITNQIAIALQNAEFLESTQEQAQQEILANEINLKIQNAKTVEQAMQIAVRELGRALDAPKTRIKLQPHSSFAVGHTSNGSDEQTEL